tara:strand:+ start:17893 stop:18480 length:588 start_codon:yes stop_codon:yes gene_type:complete
MLQNLYNKILRYADHPHAEWVLFFVAFVESSFFPIPPDVLLIPMVIVNFDRAFRYAFICTAGSVLGGIAGYALGYFFFDSIGAAIIDFYGAGEKFASFQGWYAKYDVYIIAMAGITPIPYKIVTIASGLLNANFVNFVLASVVARFIRFFLISWLLWRGGPSLKGWIENNLYPITMAAGVAFILIVVLFKVLFGG